MQDQDLAGEAAALAARFKAAGVNAEPGLGGSVIIYASSIEAGVLLTALEHGDPEAGGEQPGAAVIRAAAEQERDILSGQENARHTSATTTELRRHEHELADIARVYRLRTGALHKQGPRAGSPG